MYAETSDKDGSSSEGEREQSRSATHLGFFESVHTDGEEEGKDKSVGIVRLLCKLWYLIGITEWDCAK